MGIDKNDTSKGKTEQSFKVRCFITGFNSSEKTISIRFCDTVLGEDGKTSYGVEIPQDGTKNVRLFKLEDHQEFSEVKLSKEDNREEQHEDIYKLCGILAAIAQHKRVWLTLNVDPRAIRQTVSGKDCFVSAIVWKYES